MNRHFQSRGPNSLIWQAGRIPDTHFPPRRLPDMATRAALTHESLQAQTARVRVEFLERELDVTGTMIELTRLEAQIEAKFRVAQAMQHVCQGLDTVRKFLNQVSSPDDHARIARRLEELEAQVAKLAADLVLNGKVTYE